MSDHCYCCYRVSSRACTYIKHIIKYKVRENVRMQLIKPNNTLTCMHILQAARNVTNLSNCAKYEINDINHNDMYPHDISNFDNDKNHTIIYYCMFDM